eukprot:GHVT01087865.1.p2 GENE.GHVT01087865.1~~GHVT01087865.1.p2  ORF type:complete len:100 (+),score=14.09 GHVT01087865.1:297-596(+)
MHSLRRLPFFDKRQVPVTERPPVVSANPCQFATPPGRTQDSNPRASLLENSHRVGCTFSATAAAPRRTYTAPTVARHDAYRVPVGPRLLFKPTIVISGG